MVKLNEYLGGLVSSITNARVAADIQSIKVAEQYAKHSLLQHYPIPRMRVEDVELTIPVAVESFNERTETIYEPVDKIRFNEAVLKEITEVVKIPRITAEISNIFSAVISEKTEQVEKEINLQKSAEPLKSYSQKIIEELANKSDKLQAIIKERKSDPVFEKALQNVNLKLLGFLREVSKKNVVDIIEVTVESDKLREKRQDNLVFIRMKVVEDGMEWHKMENSKGEVEKKLLPE